MYRIYGRRACIFVYTRLFEAGKHTQPADKRAVRGVEQGQDTQDTGEVQLARQFRQDAGDWAVQEAQENTPEEKTGWPVGYQRTVLWVGVGWRFFGLWKFSKYN
jgi:hypothetical protein